MADRAIALAMTGASGSPYGMRLLDALLAADREVWLMISPPGRVVLETEMGLALAESPAEDLAILDTHLGAHRGQLRVFGTDEWTAPAASGSNPPEALVVCPCTAGTLAAIATGQSRSLIERCADVVIKEHRQLILVPREMPLSALHLENMLRLSRVGATIMPACPGFYHRPKTLSDVVDFVVARILDHLGVDHTLGPRWGIDNADASIRSA